MEENFHIGLKALFVNASGEVLILQAHTKKYQTNPGEHWDLPGGRIQKNESFEEGLKREVWEELGLKDFEIGKMLDVSISKHRVNKDDKSFGLLLVVYLCTLPLNTKIELTDDEHLSFKWVTPQKAAVLLNDKFSDQFSNKVKKL